VEILLVVPGQAKIAFHNAGTTLAQFHYVCCNYKEVEK